MGTKYEEKNSGNKIKAKKGANVRIGDGPDEKQTAELVGKTLAEKLQPVAQTVFDTANTVGMAVADIDNLSALAERMEINRNAGYNTHIEAGWNYLCYGKFDRAMYEFRDALNYDNAGHEAHFGLALATNKIQLLDIGGENKNTTFNKIPIYYDIDGVYLENAFERDPHYKQALQYSNDLPEIQNKYKDCAKKIKDIISAFRRYSAKNKKYDCFICAKVTELDGNGKPIKGTQTEDCKWAIELHNRLKKEGLNPFFSEKDIAGQTEVAGTEYEALILYALIHSKCMVIVCSDERYFRQSQFMQNEYRRFNGFLKAIDKRSDNIYLVRKDENVYLPERGETEDCIRTQDEKDYKKVVKYVSLKIRGEAVNASAKKYCLSCDESYGAGTAFCPKCGKQLVSFEQYETYNFKKVQEQKRQAEEVERFLKQREQELDRKNREFEKLKQEFEKQLREHFEAECNKKLYAKKVQSNYHTLDNYNKNEFEIEGTVLTAYKITDKIGEVKIPQGITSIGNCAFCGEPSPDIVQTIGDQAFGFRSVTSITIPDSVQTIGDFAFGYCSGLTSVTIPKSVQTIGDDAFYECYGLKHVTIPRRFEYSLEKIFDNCKNIDFKFT